MEGFFPQLPGAQPGRRVDRSGCCAGGRVLPGAGGQPVFNLWVYDLEQITLEEGSWEARLTVSQTDPALAQTIETLEQYANIKTVTVNQVLSDPHTAILDLTFKERGDMFRDLAQIKERLALSDEAIATHDLLLSRYLVRNPNDPTPSLLLPFFLAVLGVVAAALVLLIRNSFEITMQARLHQFGILASIGATPRQIRTCLLQEAAALALAPLLLGLLLGFCACFGALAAVNAAAADVAGRHAATFQLHPLVVAGLAVAAFGTVLVSAWLPAHRLSRMSPLEALRDGPAPSAPGAQSDINRHGCCGCGLAYAGNWPAALCAPRKSPCGSPMFRFSYPFWASRRCFASLHCQASVPT